jgi:hypothetical protein
MRVTAVSLLVAVAACASQDERAGSAESAAAGLAPSVESSARARGREPFTRTSEIEIDGERVGYLVEYLPIPAAVDAERALPTGSYRIQAADFEDVGFMSPRGELYRFRGTESVALGHWSRDTGLLTFFGGGRRIVLRPLEPSPRRPAPEAAEPAAGDEGAGEEPAEEMPEDE